MSTPNGKPPRRERVEKNIYRKPNGSLEVVFRDSFGVQKYQPIEGGIMAARRWRDDTLGRKARGEVVQPNRRLKFGEAADKWLSDQVSDLRPTTQAAYANAIENHLRPRWGSRRMDAVSTDDAATLVRELRASGMAERSIGVITGVAGRVFKFAARRMAWHGHNPIPLLENGERPSTTTGKRRIYLGDELAQTLAAAHDPWRTLFSLAAVTGARKSELLALRWADVDLSDPEDACIAIGVQVDRKGEIQPLKTEDSLRSVELPRSVVALLLAHKAKATHCQDSDFIFCTRTGKALSQRNALRALKQAQRRATTPDGKPTFPKLHEERPKGVPVPRDAAPNFHGFRHSAASHAIAAGDSAEEVSWQLGHKNSVVTRQVYVQEVKSAERRAMLRAKMEDRYGAMIAGSTEEAAKRSKAQQEATAPEAEVVDLAQVRNAQQ